MRQLAPGTRSQLYWAARLTSVNRMEDLARFDSVFAATFGDAPVGAQPPGWDRAPRSKAAVAGMPARGGPAQPAAVLPWSTRPARMAVPADGDTGPANARVPDPLPSRIAARAEEPFDRFDPDDLRLLGSWLQRRWPGGRSGAACGSSPAGTARRLTCAAR